MQASGKSHRPRASPQAARPAGPDAPSSGRPSQAIYLPALVAARFNPDLTAKYNHQRRKAGQGRPHRCHAKADPRRKRPPQDHSNGWACPNLKRKFCAQTSWTETTPRSSPVKPPAPLGFHNSVSPSRCAIRMPDWPLPLKSPVPAICQLDRNDAEILARQATRAVGVPQLRIAVAVAP